MPLYNTLKIEPAVADRFRDFSANINQKQSKSLNLMLSFFEENNLTPFDDVKGSFLDVRKLLEKNEKYFAQRIDAVIAIMRSQENKEMKPTHYLTKEIYRLLLNQPKKTDEIQSKNEEKIAPFDDVNKIKKILESYIDLAKIGKDNLYHFTLPKEDFIVLKRTLKTH